MASSLCIVWRRGCLGKKCANAEKKCVIRVSGRFPLEKKKMSFCHPVVSLFPDLFKLLCKKCGLIGVRACVLPRPRECLSAGASTRGWPLPRGIGRGLCAPARQQTPEKPAHAPCF